MKRNYDLKSIHYKEISDFESLAEAKKTEGRIKLSLYNAIKRDFDLNNPALTYRSAIISYKELLQNIDVYARKLYKLGVRKDTKVCLICPNCPQTVYLIYALNKIGAISLILFPTTTEYEALQKIDEVECEYFFTTDIFVRKYPNVQAKLYTYLISMFDYLNKVEKAYLLAIYNKDIQLLDKNILLNNIEDDTSIDFEINNDCMKPSFYLGSGGTTGKSKIIVLNDKGINTVSNYCAYILRKRQKDLINTSMMALIPFFHGYGLTMGLHAPLYNGACSALFVKFDVNAVITAIKKNRINYMISVPYMIRKILENRRFYSKGLKYLTHVFIGASHPEYSLLKTFDEAMTKYNSSGEILEGYGLTEVSTVNVVSRKGEKKYLSVGKPLPFVKAKIATKDNYFVTENNVIGELCLNSETIMLNYYNEELNNDIYIVDSDGRKYLKTGDLAYIDEDGFIYIVGRIKNIIKISGYTIFPEDICKVACQNFLVKDAAVKVFSDGTHKQIYLYLEVERKHQTEDLVLDVQNALKEKLIKYAQPYKIVVVDNLPRNNAGKIDYLKLERE